MGLPVQPPIVGEVINYVGVYCPKADCILVRVPCSARKLIEGAATLVGLLVAFWLGIIGWTALFVLGGLGALFVGLHVFWGDVERWQPLLPMDFVVDLEDKGGNIEFEGMVSPRGRFGHKGEMHRTVEIVRIIRYDEACRPISNR